MEIVRGSAKEAVGRLEEAAKQLITITSLLQGIYFAAISFGDLKKALIEQHLEGYLLVFLAVLFLSPILMWLISLGLAAYVLVPKKRLTNLSSPYLAREMYVEAIDYKSKYLHYAHQALLLGFVLLVITVFVYLVFIQVPSESSQDPSQLINNRSPLGTNYVDELVWIQTSSENRDKLKGIEGILANSSIISANTKIIKIVMILPEPAKNMLSSNLYALNT